MTYIIHVCSRLALNCCTNCMSWKIVDRYCIIHLEHIILFIFLPECKGQGKIITFQTLLKDQIMYLWLNSASVPSISTVSVVLKSSHTIEFFPFWRCFISSKEKEEEISLSLNRGCFFGFKLWLWKLTFGYDNDNFLWLV